jgi:hemin uptake protein HemP
MTDELPPTNKPAGESRATPPVERDVIRVVRSEEIFAGERIVLIQHGGEQYRLLVTRNDRLILQK